MLGIEDEFGLAIRAIMLKKEPLDMKTRIVRVGNTLSVEIPEDVAAQASLTAGESVEWVSSGPGSLSLVRRSGQGGEASAAQTHATIEELLDGLEEGTRLGEYDWGPPRGAEIW